MRIVLKERIYDLNNYHQLDFLNTPEVIQNLRALSVESLVDTCTVYARRIF